MAKCKIFKIGSWSNPVCRVGLKYYDITKDGKNRKNNKTNKFVHSRSKSNPVINLKRSQIMDPKHNRFKNKGLLTGPPTPKKPTRAELDMLNSPKNLKQAGKKLNVVSFMTMTEAQ